MQQRPPQRPQAPLQRRVPQRQRVLRQRTLALERRRVLPQRRRAPQRRALQRQPVKALHGETGWTAEPRKWAGWDPCRGAGARATAWELWKARHPSFGRR